jgi:hypothetical protein
MKKFAILICACAAAYAAFNLQPLRISINEFLNAGTLKGLENCVSLSKSQLVSRETTQNVCITSFQKPLFDGNLVNGRAGPRFRDNTVFLGGELQNDTTEFVTTWVRAYLGYHDTTGAKTEFFGETFVWIEPQNSTELNLELEGINHDDFKNLEFCDKGADEETYRSCKYWGVSHVMGIEI